MTRFILNLFKPEIPGFNSDIYTRMFLNPEQSARLLKPEGDKFFKKLAPEVKSNLMIIIQGKETYDYLRTLHTSGKIHIGLRSFDYTDITAMEMCWIEGVRFVFFRHLPSKASGIIYTKWCNIIGGKCDKSPIPLPEIKLVNTYDEFLVAANEIRSINSIISYDYETYGFPESSYFENLCVSFHGNNKLGPNGTQRAWSINLKAIHRSPDDKKFRLEYTKLLKDIENRLVCFNAEFEPRCTYWETKEFITVYRDLWAYVRSLDLHTRNLKYFIQYQTKQPSWDDESDRIQDIATSIFNKWKTWDEFVSDTTSISKMCKTWDEAYSYAKRNIEEAHPDWVTHSLNDSLKWTPKTFQQFLGKRELTPELSKAYEDYLSNFKASLDKWNHDIPERIEKETLRQVDQWRNIWEPALDLTKEFWGNTWGSVRMDVMMTYNALDSFYTTVGYDSIHEEYGDSLDRAAEVITHHKMLSAIFQLNGIKMDEYARCDLYNRYAMCYSVFKLVAIAGQLKIAKEELEKAFPNWREDYNFSPLFWELYWWNSNITDEATRKNIAKQVIMSGMPKVYNQGYNYDNLARFPSLFRDLANMTISEWWDSLPENITGVNWNNAKLELINNFTEDLENRLSDDIDLLNHMICDRDSQKWADELERLVYEVLDSKCLIKISDKSKYSPEFFIRALDNPDIIKDKTPIEAQLYKQAVIKYGKDELTKVYPADFKCVFDNINNYRKGLTKIDKFYPDLYQKDLIHVNCMVPLSHRKIMTMSMLNRLMLAEKVIGMVNALPDIEIVNLKNSDLKVLGYNNPNELEDWITRTFGKTNSSDFKFDFINFLNINCMQLGIDIVIRGYWNGEEGEELRDNIIEDMKDYSRFEREVYLPTIKAAGPIFPQVYDTDEFINPMRELLPGFAGKGIHSITSRSTITDDLISNVYYMAMSYGIFNSLTKELSTYITGQTESSSETYKMDEHMQSQFTYEDRYNNCNYVMLKPQWKVCLVETKRWSSGFHTFPPTCDVLATWVPETEDRLFYYFDCSQAEVKTCAYMSGDPNILQFYAEGKDIYVEMAKVAFKEKFNKSVHRKLFKSVVLGLLYGRGIKSIAEACYLQMEEAQRLVDLFREMFPVMNQFIQQKVEYAKFHEEIDTLLGDKVYLRYGDNPTTCGINYFVQGGSALMLGNGFYNCAYSAIKNKLGVLSKGMIHDAYFGTLFARLVVFLYFYFQDKFTNYINNTYHITYLYDFELGTNFRDKVHCSIDTETGIMTLKGESIYVKKVGDTIVKFNKYCKDITEYFPNWDNPDAVNIERQRLMNTGLTKDEAKAQTKSDKRFRYGKPDDSLSSYYSRKNHHFSQENNFYIYPDSEMQIQIDLDYMHKCIDDVKNENYTDYTCGF